MAKEHTITTIVAREILDSRGNPTVQARVTLVDGTSAAASVPSGASTGVHEALELRDGGKRYGGKGVQKAVKNVNQKIAKKLNGMDVREQQAIDATMLALDGTPNKKKLGANAILAVSLACARTAALAEDMPLYRYIRTAYDLPLTGWRMPYATMNILNGGQHADNGLSVQEFMVVPKAKTMRERVRWGAEIFQNLKSILKQRGESTLVGDEGGFAPSLGENVDAITVIMDAIKKAGYTVGKQVTLATDIAASEFYNKKTDTYAFAKDRSYTREEMIDGMALWAKKYPFESIEDPLDQDDWEGWRMMTERIGSKTLVVGDDFLVTNTERLRRSIVEGSCNAILIKLNQIGSLSETIDAIMEAKAHGFATSVSHRSGETCDTFIADLAVAVNSEYIKTGSLSRSERVGKYNRLMEIEEELFNSPNSPNF